MKVKIKHNYILTCCVGVLALICVLSIYSPIAFSNQQTERETSVKHYLVQIRLAEEKYRAKTGSYTASFDSLIQYRYLADSLQFIPFTNRQKFELETSMQLSPSGKQIPLMECRAKYTDFLQGLNKSFVQELIENELSAGRYPGLKIGDLQTPNNNAGNWE